MNAAEQTNNINILSGYAINILGRCKADILWGANITQNHLFYRKKHYSVSRGQNKQFPWTI